ncbi:MAG: hypothetical protein GY854_16335 [Deltaproteobacteria bacterium]|nr:hypothetical protein [Deltaproteobacteria bacterium]
MDHLKPLHKPRSIPVLQSVHGLTITMAADELLLEGAEIISEGEVAENETREGVYYGSTLVTINLDREDLELGPASEQPGLIVNILSASVFFRLRLMRLARMEAERRCAPHLLRGMSAETEIRIDGHELFVDIDIECPLASPAARDSIPGEGNP